MVNVLYRSIALLSIISAAVLGAAITSGMEVMAEIAKNKGRVEVILDLPPSSLTELHIKDI